VFRRPLKRRMERLRLGYMLEKNQRRGAIHRPGTKMNALREKQCRDFIEREFADHPDLKEAVTPKYPYPGKRPILNSTFYRALKRDNVELIPRAVESVTEHGIVDTEGNEYPIDVLVMPPASNRPTTSPAWRSPDATGGRSTRPGPASRRRCSG
jgi:cation diffusion facilitator CzcD-associated flavoprotein CzcO